MNEEDAVLRMKSLQSSLNTAMKYSSARDRFPAILFIALLTLLGSVFIVIIADIYDYVTVYPQMGVFPILPGGYVDASVFAALLWIVMSFVAYSILKAAYSRGKGIDWETDLAEGALGILKIVEREDWENILGHLRKAKQAFLLLSVLQMVVYWLLASVLLWFFYGLIIQAVFGIPLNSLIILPLAAILVVILGDKSLQKSYNELWYMGNLITELRWFYLEFQGSGI